MIHTPPVEQDLKTNEQFEPEGERIRRELLEFLTRNKIVSMCLDTPLHVVEVQSATLPPKIKNVRSIWGSVYVLDESPDVDRWAAYVPPTRPEGWDDNVIPPMTHPMCTGWKQPDTALVTVTSEVARMPTAVFDRLMEYSSTMPSGVYEGKMWKARQYKVGDKEGEGHWALCWYGYSRTGPDHVSNNHRWIELVDSKEERE